MRAIEDIMESNTFRQHRTDGVSAERALVLSAGEISRSLLESDTVTPDNRRHADAYAILSHLDEFIHGVEAMRHHHHVERLDKKTVEASKLRLVEFNHAVQDMLDSDPTIEFDEIVAFLSTMHGVINRNRWGDDKTGWNQEAAWFHHQVEVTVQGMQQEIFGEQIASHVPGVVVERPTDPHDDLRGVDRWITMNGVRFPADFKASYETARHAREKSHHPEQIVYTGVEGPRFRKALRLDTRDIDLRTEQMHRQLIASLETSCRPTCC